MTTDQHRRSQVEVGFPKLRLTTWEISSEPDTQYNCIAWAAGDDSRFWWPAQRYFWPLGVKRELSITAFDELFRSLGFKECPDPGDGTESVQRLALFARGTEPTHAARQLINGRWTSKLGKFVDIVHHRVQDLEGHAYGLVVRMYCRDPEVDR